MLLHVVPVSAFLGEHFIDLREVDTMRQLPLIEVRLEEYRRNLDGVVSYDRREGGVAYTQLFHNGIVEAVCAAPLSEEGCFFPRWFEVAIPKAIQQYLRLLSTREVSTPIFVFFTLLGLKGVRLVFSGMWKETSDPLDRDVASFPELALEGFGFEDSHKKQFIDQVWQAFGRGEAPN